MARKLLVTALWDSEASVWVATSDDIPGLVTEAQTLDRLLQRVVDVAPELLNDNAHLIEPRPAAGETFDICIMSEVTMSPGRAA
jgi:predicted RNase H-like HicB family nuclease